MKITQISIMLVKVNGVEKKMYKITISAVPITHFKLILVLPLIPAFKANTDTANITYIFSSIEHHQ